MKSKTSGTIRGYICASIATVLWGATYILKENILKSLSPLELLCFSMIFTVLIILIIIIVSRKSLKISKKNIAFAMISGLSGILAVQFLSSVGIQYVGGVASSVVFATVPCMCILMDIAMRIIKVKVVSLIATLTSFAGVFLVVASEGLEAFNAMGYICLLLTNIFWIIYCKLKSMIYGTEAEIVILFYQFLGATIVAVAIGIIYSVPFELMIDPKIAIDVAYVAVGTLILCTLFFNIGIKHIGVIRANVISNFIPIVTLLINIIGFSAQVMWVQILGVFMVVVSVIVFMINSRQSL